MMMTYKDPNWKQILKNADEILVSSHIINSFPFGVKKLVQEYRNISCISFDKATTKYNIPIHDFGSDSAIITQKLGRSIIFYNTKKPEAHIRFSILHEFGHAVNGHKLTHKDTKTYGVKEVETNFFAAQLLMPEQLIRELQRRGVGITKQFLINAFNVSPLAADKRLNTLRKINWDGRSKSEREYDDLILFKYSDFLNSIQPSSYKNLDYFEDEYEMENLRSTW